MRWLLFTCLGDNHDGFAGRHESVHAGGGDAEQGAARASAGTGLQPLRGLRGGMGLDALAGLGEGDGGADEWMATLQKSRPDLFTSNAQVQHGSML